MRILVLLNVVASSTCFSSSSSSSASSSPPSTSPALPPPPPPPPPPPTEPSPSPPSNPQAGSTTYKTSTTRYSTTNFPTSACGGGSLEDIVAAIGTDTYDGYQFFAVAAAQSMGQGLVCNSADNSAGTGCPSASSSSAACSYSGVLHRGCAECIKFTTTGGTAVGAIVMDTCPYDGNEEWCPKSGGTNTDGYYNHLDFAYTTETTITNAIGDNPTGTIEAMDCPDALTTALTDYNGNAALCTYWEDSDGNPQGCPGMDDAFDCIVCSGNEQSC